MPSRKKRKRYRLRAEATAGVKTPKNRPGGEPAPGALRGSVGEQPETSLFRSKRAFYEDNLLLRQAMREDWDVPQRQRQAISAALGEVVLKTASGAAVTDATGPGKYHWKTRHRLAATNRLVAMVRQNLENVPRATTMQDVVREVEERRQARAGRDPGRAGPAG